MKLKIRDWSPQKKTEMLLIEIINILDKYDHPITLRQIFYRLVAQQKIENTKKNYIKISGICSNGRYGGFIDWDSITDETRGTYKTTSWNNIDDAVKSQLRNFRLNRWKNSPYYVEVWAEKRGFVNEAYGITNGMDVHLTPGGGFNSTTAIWDAVRRLIEWKDKEIHIFYFGDLDPSGDFMDIDITNRLSEFVDVNVHREMLTLEQVHKWNLPRSYNVPSRDSNGREYDKLLADPRGKRFLNKYGDLFQIEIDAVDPAQLSEQVHKSVSPYLPDDYYEIIEQEKEQRKIIETTLGYGEAV